MTEAVKRVYAFGKDANGNNVTEGNTEMKWVLGGKGANLAEMANIVPVPPGSPSRAKPAWSTPTPATFGRKARSTPSPSTAPTWRSAWASASVTPRIRCSCPFAPAPPSPCPA
ncbi:MAG: hypothetical protein ACLSGS_01010 [Adlercreutzia sp.]